jgi:hypothetical protein
MKPLELDDVQITCEMKFRNKAIMIISCNVNGNIAIPGKVFLLHCTSCFPRPSSGLFLNLKE